MYEGIITVSTMNPSLLRQLLSKPNPTLILHIREAICQQADQITSCFYEQLMKDTVSSKYLSHDMVKRHLSNSMMEWLCDLTTPKDNE